MTQLHRPFDPRRSGEQAKHESPADQYAAILANPEIKEAELEVLFDGSPIGKAFLSTDGYFMKVNNAFCRITGYSAMELQGVRSLIQLIHPDDSGAAEVMLEAISAGDLDSHQVNLRYLTKVGGSTWVDLTVNRVSVKEGTVVHLVAVSNPVMIPDQYLRKVQEPDGKVSLRPFVPIGEFLVSHWKYIAPVVLTALGGLGVSVRAYYTAVAQNEVLIKQLDDLNAKSNVREKQLQNLEEEARAFRKGLVRSGLIPEKQPGDK